MKSGIVVVYREAENETEIERERERERYYQSDNGEEREDVETWSCVISNLDLDPFAV